MVALVAVPDDAGGWAVGATLAAGRARAGRAPAYRTATDLADRRCAWRLGPVDVFIRATPGPLVNGSDTVGTAVSAAI